MEKNWGVLKFILCLKIQNNLNYYYICMIKFCIPGNKYYMKNVGNNLAFSSLVTFSQ